MENSREQKIWNRLRVAGLNAYGAAGVMGNLYKESALNPQNLQNTGNTKLGLTDEEYTRRVDSGEYTNFVQDKQGYGLAQWTFWSRKQALFDFAKAAKASIGDLEMQLDFLVKELKQNYPAVWNVLRTAKSVREASNIMLFKFEAPADQSTRVQNDREAAGQVYYNKYSGKDDETMSNSTLVDCTRYSPNHSGKRTHALDTLTPHCVVGQLSAETIGDCFPKGREASCNYGIGYDGRVCLVVDEANRSWCTSSNANDQRAITIECASDKTEPYTMNNAVYEKLILLCADICKRYGKKKVLWLGSKEKTLAYTPKSDEMVLTAHRWFANKSCPGEWLYSRYGDLANRINALLGTASTTPSTPAPAPETGSKNTNFPATPFTVRVIVPDLNYRAQPSMSGAVKGQTGIGTFTIVEVKDGWGRLKSGAGWIYLENPSYTTINKSATAATEIKVGDVVQFKGGPHYVSANATSYSVQPKAGPAKVTAISKGAKHPYHVIHTTGASSVYGWVDADKISK